MPEPTTGSGVTIRRAADRFHTKAGWLDSWHTFSFGEHHDPAHMGYRQLRVINDDIVAPGQGFGMHPHRSMEIFTYIISGQLEHKDSMGNGRVIGAGEFQYMSAGDGVLHSEFNPSDTEPVQLLQIWITPKHPGGEPRYQDLDTKPLRRENGLTLLASGDGRDGSIAIRQDAEIHFGHLDAGAGLRIDPPHTWLHLIAGEVGIGAATLAPGDGAAIDGPADLASSSRSEFLLFRLP
ncbi:MAG: pirin family protein [Akkermansiaceae bacterium]|nr:pirin family protein [Akkermansiaceae bacterium]NNM29018.1 pirin family protein [Akkermansiaceae bacterium]